MLWAFQMMKMIQKGKFVNTEIRETAEDLSLIKTVASVRSQALCIKTNIQILQDV
jgi:hypothetical protein